MTGQWSDVSLCHWHISCVAQHYLRTWTRFACHCLSTCVSAEVDRLCLALRAHGLLFWVPLDFPLVTGPVFGWKPCRAPCWRVKCSCTSPRGLKTDKQRRCFSSSFFSFNVSFCLHRRSLCFPKTSVCVFWWGFFFPVFICQFCSLPWKRLGYFFLYLSVWKKQMSSFFRFMMEFYNI